MRMQRAYHPLGQEHTIVVGLQASLSIRKSPCVHFVGAQTLLKKHGYWPLVRLKEAGAIVLLTRA